MMKLYSIYTKSFALLTAALVGSVAQLAAQDMTSYFMPNSVARRNINVAFTPNQGYISIPFLGNTLISTNGNTALGDLVYPYNGDMVSLFDTNVPASTALSPLDSDANTFGVDMRLSLLNFGAYTKDGKSFWDFSLNMRNTSNFSIPYELFEFMKTGDNVNIEDVNINLESYAEVAFGYTKSINDKLTVGGRVKLLAGLVNANLTIDQMNVSLDGDAWQAQAQGTLDLNMAGTTIESTMDENGNEIFDLGDLNTSLSSPAGYGAAIDLGATYKLLDDRLEISLSANDIGFIRWSASNNTSATVANNFTFTGVKVDVGDDGSTDSTTIELDDIEFVKSESKGESKWLQADINLGAEYSFFEEKLGVGAIYSTHFWRSKTITNLAASAAYTPIKWFTFATSYTFTNNSSNAFGFAANFATGFINLYLSSDILTSKKSAQLVPINQSMMNISFGLAVPIGTKRAVN